MALWWLRGADVDTQRKRLDTTGIAARILVGLRPLVMVTPNLWVLVAMLLVASVLYYVSLLPFYPKSDPFDLIEGNVYPVLLVVPVVYGAFVFGPRGGTMSLMTIAIMMLPRAFLVSSERSGVLLNTTGVVVVSIIVILWSGSQKSEKERRRQALSKLESARLELASHVTEVSKRQRQLAGVNEVARVATQSLELPIILKRILDKTLEVTGIPAGLIFLKDNESQKLRLVAHQGVPDDVARSLDTLIVGEGSTGSVAESGKPLTVRNTEIGSPPHTPLVGEEYFQSQFIVPLMARGQTIGTLSIAARCDRRFSSEEKELLTAIGSQVGVAIENAHLYREALASQQRYRDLFENATAAIFVHDLQGWITDANHACADLAGYPRSQLPGMHVSQLFPSLTLEFLSKMAHQQSSIGTSVEPYEVKTARRDGTKIILSMTSRVVTENEQDPRFHHVARDVTEQKRMQGTLDRYVRQILTAQEDERRRIARELHDETAQSLLIISQRLDGVASDPQLVTSDALRVYMEQTRMVTIQTLNDLRRITQDLRPRILDDLGLVAALEWLADDLQKESGLLVKVKVPSPQPTLRPEVQLLLFRIAQEALSNVRRHSGAAKASVVLECNQDRAKLTISDDGRGFRVPDGLAELADEGKLGLLGMHERARLLNGALSVRSSPNEGTVVVAELPT